MQLTRMFPDDAAAERWLEKARWPSGVRCPKCDSDNIQRAQHGRSRTAILPEAVKTDSLMHNSPLRVSNDWQSIF